MMKRIIDKWSFEQGQEFERTNLIEALERILEKYFSEELYISKCIREELNKLKGKKEKKK